VTGTLDALATLTCEAAIRSPALLVVGETAALAGSLGWFGATAATGATGTVQAAAAA
jgi:uroporphyrin-III C-methyltransferase/precorrin-2 dehydrogenase/sirohydrochlorin ferrochelatase